MLLSSVLQASQNHRKVLSPSLAKDLAIYDTAFSKGKNVSDYVNNRVVRATFSAVEKLVPQLSLDKLENPFSSPHNLSWYFNSCTCPTEIRAFATRIGKQHIRVWSVAQDASGWKVLVQVFGTATQIAAAKALELETRVPALALKKHALGGITDINVKPAGKAQLASYVLSLIERVGSGHFVEVSLIKVK